MGCLGKTATLTAVTLVLAAGLTGAQSKPTDWDKIVEAAKKEGKVVASIPPSPELRKGMEIAFTRRYGIGVEFVPARGGAIVQRMVSETKTRRAVFRFAHRRDRISGERDVAGKRARAGGAVFYFA